MDARRTPGRIFNDHLKDQVTDFFGNSLPAAHWVSGLAQLGPVPSESLAVPADHGLGHDEEERLFPLRPELESGDPKELVEHTEFWFGMSALQHDKLLSKSQVLQKQILSVANTAKGCSEPQAKQVEHGGRVIADEILACTPMLLISKPDRIVARDSSIFWRMTGLEGSCAGDLLRGKRVLYCCAVPSTTSAKGRSLPELSFVVAEKIQWS